MSVIFGKPLARCSRIEGTQEVLKLILVVSQDAHTGSSHLPYQEAAVEGRKLNKRSLPGTHPGPLGTGLPTSSHSP